MSDTRINGIRGMNDILPAEMPAWHYLESAVRACMHAYDYREMRTPIVEFTHLFQRSIGEVTDIVEKEMYTFPDRKGASLTLRPEGTASCVRAALQHGLLQQGGNQRIWYQGPMFRYERPQKGRTRQFHQVGAEVYGVPGPAIEAELILLSARLWRQLGIDNLVQLEINTLGSSEDRDRYRQLLVDYFNDHINALDEDSVRRLKTNPLRILDSKNPAMANVLGAAPRLDECLSQESADHFAALQSLLASSGIQSVVNARLVRGLDYYSHSVFEWTTEHLGAQSAVCGGGRYDGLIRELSGKDGHAVGWAMGLERLVLLIQQVQGDALHEHPDVFLVVASDVGTEAGMRTAEWLRDQLPGLSVSQSPQSQLAQGASFKSQFKQADRSGARFALVLGQQEHDDGQLTLKPLRAGGSSSTANEATIPAATLATTPAMIPVTVNEQQTLPRQDIIALLKQAI